MAPEAQQAITELQVKLQQAEKLGVNSQKLLGEAMQSLSEERLKNRAKDSDNTIDAYEADTKRLAVVKDMIPMDPEAMGALIRQVVTQAMQDNLGPIVAHLGQSAMVDASPEGPPGATASMPIRTPDVGQQMATPGGA